MTTSTKMATRLGLLTLAALASSACTRTDHEDNAMPSVVADRTQYTPPSGRGQRVGAGTLLNAVSTTHIFSNPATPDRFVLQMRGVQPTTSRLLLSVVTAQGDTLRHEVLPARLLLDDPTLRDNASASVRDQDISILRGMNKFFAPSQFVQPAVAAGTAQPAELDTQTWNSLRNDPAAVGFDYLSSEGTPRRLAYSRRLGHVLLLPVPGNQL